MKKDSVLEKNEKEDFVKLCVDSRVYSKESIFAAGYIFLDRAYIYLDKEAVDKIGVWLYRKDKKENLDILGKEFYNELLNYAHYFSSLKTNAESLKLILQRALFSAAPSMVQEAEEKEIEDLIKELEEEEKQESGKKK
ncbi:MAG: hypothetical protein NC923_05095 [Candidatus Omnitrophica bacterium]|nr:hypothetical protein [Candidatus Omnitrophota bacterium]